MHTANDFKGCVFWPQGALKYIYVDFFGRKWLLCHFWMQNVWRWPQILYIKTYEIISWRLLSKVMQKVNFAVINQHFLSCVNVCTVCKWRHALLPTLPNHSRSWIETTCTRPNDLTWWQLSTEAELGSPSTLSLVWCLNWPDLYCENWILSVRLWRQEHCASTVEPATVNPLLWCKSGCMEEKVGR